MQIFTFLILFIANYELISSQFFNQSVCYCVTAGNCGATGGNTNDGSGQIDIRIVNVIIILKINNHINFNVVIF